jgi:hypothetical protein
VSLATYDEWVPVAAEVLGHRAGGDVVAARMGPPEPSQPMGYFAAVDETGRAIAIAGVAIFGTAAVLFSLLTRPQHPASATSRYLLHTFLRGELRARGVDHLIAGSALRQTKGVQYFQHLLGYEVRNLSIILDLRGEGRRVASESPPARLERSRDMAQG